MKIFDFIFYCFFCVNLIYGNSPSGFLSSDKDKFLLEIISYVIEKGHYDPKEMDDEFSENVFNSFIDAIDGQQRFFLKTDLNNFKRYKYEIDDQLRSSNIDFFNIVYNKSIQRIEEVRSFYPSLLEKPFNFNLEETTSLDFKNNSFAANLNDLKQVWRKRFKLSTLDRFVSKKEEEIFKKKIDSSYQIKSDLILEKESRASTLQNINDYFQWMDELERKDTFNAFVNSVVNEFDPHTQYFAPQDKELFDTSMSGKFEGIGARLQKKNEQVKIVEIILGGPVWRDNSLEPGDQILYVAQPNEDPVEISGMRLDDSIKLIKGPKGTNVILTVKRVNGEIEDVVIERDIVVLEESYAKSAIIETNEKKYGLIELPKFYVDFKNYGERNAATDVKKALISFKEKFVDGLIIDLRNNGGGSLKTVVDMVGYFIDKGPVVQVKSIGGRKEVLEDTDPSVIWDEPVIILVNEFSASASEILAAALQDYNRAIVMGSRQTYGKGTVQNVIDLNRIIAVNQYGDLGALKVTTDKFYRINGGSTQLEGVKSDIIFPSQYGSIQIGEKDQSNPLSWDKISPARYSINKYNSRNTYVIEKSKARLAKNPMINLIHEQGEWIKLKQKDYDFHLNYNSYINKRDNDKKYSERFDVLKEFESELAFTWLEINMNIDKSNDILIRRDRWLKGLKKDIFLDEAVNVLNDLNHDDIKLSQLN
ncbi:MAG: tail-specific protease [Flavobacteriales bacterium]|nr:tail-specific protease [Flavobacteriales bacterium]